MDYKKSSSGGESPNLANAPPCTRSSFVWVSHTGRLRLALHFLYALSIKCRLYLSALTSTAITLMWLEFPRGDLHPCQAKPTCIEAICSRSFSHDHEYVPPSHASGFFNLTLGWTFYDCEIIKIESAHNPILWLLRAALPVCVSECWTPWTLSAGGAKAPHGIDQSIKLWPFLSTYSSLHQLPRVLLAVEVERRAHQKWQPEPQLWFIGSRHVNSQCRLQSHCGSKLSCWLST